MYCFANKNEINSDVLKILSLNNFNIEERWGNLIIINSPKMPFYITGETAKMFEDMIENSEYQGDNVKVLIKALSTANIGHLDENGRLNYARLMIKHWNCKPEIFVRLKELSGIIKDFDDLKLFSQDCLDKICNILHPSLATPENYKKALNDLNLDIIRTMLHYETATAEIIALHLLSGHAVCSSVINGIGNEPIKPQLNLVAYFMDFIADHGLKIKYPDIVDSLINKYFLKNQDAPKELTKKQRSILDAEDEIKIVCSSRNEYINMIIEDYPEEALDIIRNDWRCEYHVSYAQMPYKTMSTIKRAAFEGIEAEML